MRGISITALALLALFLADPSAATPGAAQVTSTDVVAAQGFGKTLGITEWLGPLAPVALSPFFGIALLSGLALFGASWVDADNAFLGAGSPLANSTVFWVFAALTLVTSLPRFTKVSKPLAQAVDRLEAYAGIITLSALRFLMNDTPDVEVGVLHAGLFSTTVDGALVVAAAINVFVINAVKFFFEVLVWITPIPLLDALFETLNKTICAALMGIYAWSPAVATLINLVLFAICLLIFRWAYRRQVFFRTVLFDQLRAWFGKTKRLPDHLLVFPKDELDPFEDRARCRLEPTENGWRLTQERFLRKPLVRDLSAAQVRPTISAGFLTNTLHFGQADLCDCSFSRRYNDRLEEVAQALGLGTRARAPTTTEPKTARDLRAELS